MKKIQKLLSALLVLCYLIAVIPVEVLAVGTEMEQNELQIYEDNYSSTEGLSNEDAFKGYVDQLFYGSISLLGCAAGDTLTGDEKVIYDALVPYIRQIADGERTSATIAIGKNVMGYPVDAEATFTGSTFTYEMLDHIINALLADLPYAFYWYDKTNGCSIYYSADSTLQQVVMQFAVAENYQGNDLYTTNSAKTGAAKHAASNAQNIVNRYASASDYEKLLGYKNEICNLVSYNHEAAKDGIFRENNDPWQLIYVFDGDSTTNVVCEGYSKAYMYLCDMTYFSKKVACYTVSGYMSGGGHMWNIVEFGENHYLVDVTNSDANTIGENGMLFLAGGTGSPSNGYSINGISYIYDNETISLWGTGEDSILTLNTNPYSDNELNDPTELTAPTISVEDNTYNSLKISWNGVNGAQYY